MADGITAVQSLDEELITRTTILQVFACCITENDIEHAANLVAFGGAGVGNSRGSRQRFSR